MKNKSKVLKLGEGEELVVLGTNENGTVIKNEKKSLKINLLEKDEIPNLNIKKVEYSTLKDFIIIKFLEENELLSWDSKLIRDVLDEIYKELCDEIIIDKEIKNLEFQCVTTFD